MRNNIDSKNISQRKTNLSTNAILKTDIGKKKFDNVSSKIREQIMNDKVKYNNQNASIINEMEGVNMSVSSHMD